MSPEGWVKLLATYGPFALLVLLVFVIERKAWAELRDHEHPRKAAYLVYGGTWLAIFGVCAVIVWVWIRLNLPGDEFTIRGRLVGLGKTEQLFSESEDTYLRRAYSGSAKGNFVFRIISPRKLVGAEPVELHIDHGDETESVFQLAIEPWFYEEGHEVRLTYDRLQDRLNLNEAAGPSPVPRLASNIRTPTGSIEQESSASRFLFPTVYAQSEMVSFWDDLAAGLDSPDPIIRMDTRQSIVKLGSDTRPFLESLLYDPGSSTRMLVGVLNILNSGTDFAVDRQAQCNIQDLASSPDPVLKTEAEKFLASSPKTQTLNVCKPIPGRPFDCRDPRLVVFYEEGLRRFTVGRQHVYVWQRELSADDPNWATVYAIEDESLLSPERHSIGKKRDFAAFESHLQRIGTGSAQERSAKSSPLVFRATLRPESYAVFKVRNRDTIEIESSGGGKFALFIRDTHFMASTSNFQACLR
jgi:hypothetical protein